MNLQELERNYGLVKPADLERMLERRGRVSLVSRFCAWISGN